MSAHPANCSPHPAGPRCPIRLPVVLLHHRVAEMTGQPFTHYFLTNGTKATAE